MTPAMTLEIKNLTTQLEQLRHENQILNQIIIKQATLFEKARIDHSPSPLLFSDFYIIWLEAHKNNIQPSTYYEYLGIAKNHIIPYFQERGLFLTEIQASHIQDYYNYKRTHGTSNNFLIRHHVNLYTCFKFAVENDYITSNPMMKVKRPKETERFLANYYSVEQLVELFEISKDCRIYTPIILAGLLGLRRSEIIGLKWEAINFSAGTISIKRKAVKDKASNKDVISSKLKTTSSYRILPLPYALLDYLKRLKKHQARQAKSPSYSKDYLEYICLKSNGTRITLDEVTNDFRRLIQRHGLDKIRFHDLRHSCATMCFR